MPDLRLQATHKPVRDYYQSLKQFSLLHATHEGAISQAFGSLLQQCANQFKWTLINQFEIKRRKQHPLRVDGALLDPWSLAHGYWEAKDEDDDLALEVKKKIDKGYPTDNIIFQAPDRAILYQNGQRILDEKITQPPALVDVVREFFRYEPPAFDQWQRAVEEFREKVPQIGQALLGLIEKERKENALFVRAFSQFVDVCRRSLNPSLSDVAVEKMLAQHILTERIFRRVFENSDFVRRNVVANEIEHVIDALTQRSWNREKFLSSLDRFYGAIETTAETIDDFSEKQHFLNTVYENFFQGFDAKTADTHGIVYTPQPIVRFMVRSVDEILQREFGRSLGDKDVHVLDPFVGTGNFILQVMRHIPKSRLPQKYATELHANEVLLLPYYVASMNIEHEYAELTGEYKPFEGLCLVDTFELAEEKQRTLESMTERNAERVEKQREAPITVIIGNPPYNAWQADENDNNKNRKYKVIDGRVAETYAKASNATLVNSLSDPYVKAFRWASDRLGEEGVLAYVSNSGYLSQLASDGMRKHLAQDFDEIYIVDLGGNVRKNPKLSGTTHNVFGIQVGVAIGLFVRRKQNECKKRAAKIHYARTGEDWRKELKYRYLDDATALDKTAWADLRPDERHTWLRDGLQTVFDSFIPLLSTETKHHEKQAVFDSCTNGAKSNNDAYVYAFDRQALAERARAMVSAYNEQLHRWQGAGSPENIEEFLRIDKKILKWVRKTKRFLARAQSAKFSERQILRATYRPFTSTWHFFDRMFNEDLYALARVYPASSENVSIAVSDKGFRSAFSSLAVIACPEQHLCASTDAVQVFPFYLYDEDGSNRRENITDWALSEFRKHYADNKISKWDIFHYVYALLHHPEYRTRYEANLKRELPRVPYAPDFRGFAKTGKHLVELHVHYEKQREWPLRRVENPEEKLNLRVEKMKLTKDKKGIVYNDFLTLTGIPEEAFDYRLGNRSALEWIIDQYQVSTDKRSGITNDPNRLDDPEYIVRLIGQVITVSVETSRLVKNLPSIS